MTTASTRIWTFATVIVVIVVIALGWFLGVSPKLAEAARLDAERAAIELQNEATRVVNAQLEQDFRSINSLRTQIDELRDRFPSAVEYDNAIEELLAGIVGESLSLQSVVLAAPVADSPDAIVDENGQVAAGTLVRVPITITVKGDFNRALGLINRMQLSERFGIVVTADYVDGRDEEERTTVINLVIFVVTDSPVSLRDGNDPSESDGEPVPSPSASPTAEPDDETDQ
ncbi:MAG: hypothetical protein KIT89_11375 [Microcella sp.]|uniref:hypothetical protein n=1 Tax=Microcella sp. TaxID=1913979 RepID=UPI0024C6EDDA|nr:hypothetical protein [Microcella sp.]UYN83285.1 MAG: hypothetical protein KIT89_11375 [Microcella sp.]